MDVDLTDGNTHDLELYFLDWDSTARSEQVQISNAATGAVLDTETVSSFHAGVYDNWQVSGNVVIKITKLTGANAVLSGLFIDAAINGNPGFAIGAAVPGHGENASVPAYGTSDWSNPNPAGNRGNFAGKWAADREPDRRGIERRIRDQSWGNRDRSGARGPTR